MSEPRDTGTRDARIRVLLDSSFLMMPFKFRIDPFKGIEELISKRPAFLLISPVKEELLRISKGGGRRGSMADLAIKLAERCEEVPFEPPEGGGADEALIAASRELKAIVATNDSALRKKLRNINVPVIYLRGKSRLCLEGMEPEYL
jgi:rRNA-processing protein FCF1